MIKNFLKTKINSLILILLIIIFASISIITFAWFKDKKEYSGSLNFGSIELDITSGVVEATKTIDFDITRTNQEYQTGGKIMPGDTINIPLKIKLKNSEPAYYLVYLTDTKNVFENAVYFSDDGTNVYVNNGIKTYKQGDTTQTEVTNKIIGKISGTNTHSINLGVEIPLSYNVKVGTTEVSCKIMAIQQANMTESEAFDEIDSVIDPKVDFITASDWKAVITNYASLTSLGFYKKENETLTGYSKDATLTTNLDAKLASKDKGKIEVWKKTDTDIAFVSDYTIMAPKSCRAMFYNCSLLTSLNLSNFNTKNVTDMSLMFQGCSALTSLDVSKFNTSKVTSMHSMFYGLDLIVSLNLSNFNTSNVNSMANMFCWSPSIISLDLSNFDTSNVTEMSYMFHACKSLKSLNVSNFNTTKVETMQSMFCYTFALTTLDISSFNTANVTNFTRMFAEGYSNAEIKISSKFTNAGTAFTKETLCGTTNLQSTATVLVDGVVLK